MVLAGCVGGLFSMCMIFGTALDLRGSVPFGDAGMWGGIFIWGVIFTLAVRFLWNLAGGGCLAKGDSGKENNVSVGVLEEEKRGRESRRSLLFRAVIIFLCYLPVFLAVYPGFFVYDAQDEYMQVLTRNFSTHLFSGFCLVPHEKELQESRDHKTSRFLHFLSETR